MHTGDLIDGHFRLVREAGRGGMGRVFQAVDTRTGATIAIKLFGLNAESAAVAVGNGIPIAHAIAGVAAQAADSGTVLVDRRPRPDLDIARFVREAEMLAAIEHPRIVGYLGHGAAPDGTPYLAMDWLDGESLAQRLERGTLSVDEALTVVLRAAEGVAEAHRHGVIHRDIKPSNIFLVGGRVDDVKVLDFGIARRATAPTHLTASGMLIGTPAYMAPEQIQARRDLTTRVDVWALGCVLYECLCGRCPFTADGELGVLGGILVGQVPRVRASNPALPPEVDALVARLLARELTDRPLDGAAVVTEVASVLESARDDTATLDSAPLSTAEQRVQCLVIAGPLTPETRDGRMRAMAEATGGWLHPAGDTAVVSFAGRGTGTEQAIRAARLALAVRDAMPDTQVSVVTRRAALRDASLVNEVIADSATVGIVAAPFDGVRIDPGTAELLGGRFEIVRGPMGDCLQSERAASSRVRARNNAAVCVGRAREFAILDGALEQCVAESGSAVVLVTAAPGVGKTRLCDEFLRRAVKSNPTLQWFAANADPLSMSAPFGLLSTVVRGACELGATDAGSTQRERLHDAVSRDLPDANDAARVADFLAEMIGLGDAGTASERVRAARGDALRMGDALRTAFEDWLAARCASAPVLLLLEDLHWADLPSLRFIDSALRRLHDRPLMVLATARPEVHDRFPSLWAERDIQRIDLAALNQRAAEQFVRGLLGDGASPDLVQRLVARAGGNPLFLAEITRAYVERADEAALPDSLLGVLQARLDTLAPEVRRTLRAASAFGLRFWRGGIAALIGDKGSGDALDDWLADAVASGMITPASASRVPGEHEFSFGHALVRDSVYVTLTGEDRAQAHLLAAAWLEHVRWSDAALIAEHYELGAAPERALGWYRRGAQAALEGQALSLAADLAQRGLACAREPTARTALLRIAAEAALLQGHGDRAVEYATSAADASEPGSEAWLAAVGTAILVTGQRGDNAAVERWLERVIAAVPGSPQAAEARVRCMCSAATQLLAGGRIVGGMRAVEAVEVAILDVQLEALTEAWVQRMRGTVAGIERRLDDGIAAMERALASFERAGDARATCLVRVQLGSQSAVLGDLARAEDFAQTAIAAATRIGADYLALWGLYVLGKVATERGDFPAAHEALQRVIAGLPKSPRIVGGARVYLSLAAHRNNDFVRAETEARAAFEAHVSESFRAGALGALVRALVAQGRATEALAIAQDAAATLARLGAMEEFEALVRLAHAEALLAVGDRAGAATAIEAARVRLHEALAGIRNPGRRDALVSGVHVNARTMALFRELSGE